MSAATLAVHAARDAARGAAVVRRFANATARWSATASTEGIFERRIDLAALGGLQVAGRDITFECITAELPAYVTDLTPCEVALGDAPTVWLGPYRVTRGGRDDDLEDRTTMLTLERA